MDKTTGSVWYVPGGQSTIGKILADANVEYSYKDNKSNGSLALSFEKVYDSAGNADLWLFRYNSATPTSYTQLASEHHLHSMIKAFANRKCYGCNVETTLFYEETPFHPELLLNDIITIAHPDIKGLSGLRYYKPL
jgi:iron complex transport system substrate-binding protein